MSEADSGDRANGHAGQRPVALVTGVSRRVGIGCAIAQRLLADGFRVAIHSWASADHDYGTDQGQSEVAAVIDQLGGLGPCLAHVEADFADAEEAGRVVEYTVAAFGGIDALVVNHAISIAGALPAITAAELDLAWAVNARASVLLVKAFAEHHDDSLGPGRVVLFTSGQHLGPMSDELPYAISKGAIHQMTASLADALADRAISVNAINPGPVDTGWPSRELRDHLRAAFPAGRWGRPDDIAAVISFLVSDDCAWVTGQVLNAEGGFRR